MTETTTNMPERRGKRPSTQRFPNKQLDQNAPARLQKALIDRVRNLPDVSIGESSFEPGTHAFLLDEKTARGGPEAFMAGTEFAHLHPEDDGSLHIVLPREIAEKAVAKGWAAFHPFAGQTLKSGYKVPYENVHAYGPRDEEELEVVWGMVWASYDEARRPAVVGPGGTGPEYGLADRVVDQVGEWDGMTVERGRSRVTLRADGVEIGHVHLDRDTVDLPLPDDERERALASGRVSPHAAGSPGWATKELREPEDPNDAMALLRGNYERQPASAS